MCTCAIVCEAISSVGGSSVADRDGATRRDGAQFFGNANDPKPQMPVLAANGRRLPTPFVGYNSLVTKVGVSTFHNQPRAAATANFGTFVMKRKFDDFWNTLGEKVVCFAEPIANPGDKRGDFWNRESCFAKVFQKYNEFRTRSRLPGQVCPVSREAQPA